MPTFITMLKWTPNGIQNIKASPNRLDEGRKAFKQLGVDLKEVFLTMGQHDLICVLEAPDNATVARAVLSLAQVGAVSTETMAAFTEDEYRKLIGSL